MRQAPTADEERMLYREPVSSRRSPRPAGDDTPPEGASPDEAARRADPPSFDALFDEHYERLVRALTIVAGDRDVAADAVQDAFVKAHLKWGRIARYDDPSAWVRRVAINRLRNAHRGATRRRRALQRLAGRRDDVPTEPVIDEMDRLLEQLPRQQRISTALFYVEGLTVAEIASTLDISDGTVKSHLHDARRRLRSVLESESADERII